MPSVYQPAQLAALVAVVECGTFDAAARSLQVTPSAISQRIRALETRSGQVVLTRTAPCTPTPAGEVLLALGRKFALLAAEANAQLGGDAGVRRIPIAVNADSLATWFRQVFGQVSSWQDCALELFVEDQAHSSKLLHHGTVLAAVTSNPRPLQGCSIQPLGSMRYYPVATRELLARAGGASIDWSRLPMVRFNENDDLQHLWLRTQRRAEPALVHRVPTTADFAEAVSRGLGWGMYLEDQLSRARVAGIDIVELAPGRPLVIPLYWQRWRIASELLEQVSVAVIGAAQAELF